MKPLPKTLKPVIGPWLKDPKNRAAFNKAMNESMREMATHECKKCDTRKFVGCGWRSKIICSKCRKEMTKRQA